MDNNKLELLSIGFWSGVAFIGVINIILNLLHKETLAYNLYIFGLSIITLIVFKIIQVKRKK